MIRLHVLGPLSLDRADGTAIRSVMAQPKRFALLTYLASADPGARHPRDTLLGLLWPELPSDRARSALRQALHRLRRSLGQGVLTGKGRELVGVDPERLWCDAAEFARAAADGREAEALELYRGAFLEGFHLDAVPAFERWVESRRRSLHRDAVEAAWRLADRAEERGERAAARRRAERALELTPYEGQAVRRYMELTERIDEPAPALRAYRRYADRLREELDLEPPADITELAEQLRDERKGSPGDEGDGEEKTPEPGVSTPTPARAYDPRQEPACPDDGTETADARRGGGGRISSFRHAAAIGGTLLIVGVLGLAAAEWLTADRRAADTPSRASVAVLPFADMSPRGDLRWFADGVAEETLDALAKVRGIEVKGRSSSFQFTGSSPDVRMVGDSLGVSAVLEGSVRRVGERVRITVQLIRATDANHLWSETYERAFTPEAIFRVQEEVARSVADALQVELGLEDTERLARRPPVDLEAYSLYLRARHGFRQRTADGRTRARELIGRSLERDPGFAPAWTLEARIRLLEPFWEGVRGALPLDESRARALEATARSLELDPELARAHLTRAEALDHLHRWEQSRRHHRRAVEMSPGDPDVRSGYLWHLASLGRWEQALEQARYRQRLDPLYTPANGNLAEMLMYAGRPDEAVVQWDRTVALASEGDVHASFVRSLRAKAYALQGREAGAVGEARAARRRTGGSPQPGEGYYLAQLGAMEALAGNASAARARLDSVRLRWRNRRTAARRSLEALNMARVHAALGAADSAFHWLDRSRPEIWRPLEVARFRGDPWWEPVREDPRYREMLARTGTSAPGG